MSNAAFQPLLDTIQSHYQTTDFIALHTPCVGQVEKERLNECIDSTFVSSVGAFVDQFEDDVAAYTGANHAVAVVNGTLGLFLALRVVGVEQGDLVLTQSLTFVATANAIKMLNANPVFLDVDANSYGLSADDLQHFLTAQTHQEKGACIHTETGKKIKACVPMHTLGFACEIDRIVTLCHAYHIKVVEDAAESLGSFYKNKHTGTFGDIGVFSFNGNKILTAGGGGILVTNDAALAKQAKHLSTTAKIPDRWLFEHDDVGYNLRMPNLNAALGVAQMSKLDSFRTEKQVLAKKYRDFVQKQPGLVCLTPIKGSSPNYWLNGIVLQNQAQRDAFLSDANQQGIQTRPLWTPLHQLAMYENDIRTDLPNTMYLAERVVNLPSGVKCHAS